MSRNVSRGDIPALILSVLDEAPAHGYAIARSIKQKSADVLQLREGSLYPALRVLENDGFVTSTWQTPEHGPARKVYQLTNRGKQEHQRRLEMWESYASAMDGVLKSGRLKHA